MEMKPVEDKKSFYTYRFFGLFCFVLGVNALLDTVVAGDALRALLSGLERLRVAIVREERLFMMQKCRDRNL